MGVIFQADSRGPVDFICDYVANEMEGNRNNLLYWASIRCRELNYSSEETMARLLAAGKASGLSATETRRTIRSGLKTATKKGVVGSIPRDDFDAELLAWDFETLRAKYGNPPEPEDDDLFDEPQVVDHIIPDWPAPPSEAAYHGLAGVLVRAIAPHTEADPIGLLGTFLAIFGTRAGPSWSLHQGDWQHTNIFVTLVGETGVGRKGTAFGAISEVYRAADPDWRTIVVPGVGSGEGLITWLRDHKADPRGLVFETEFSRLLISMTREGSTLSPVIRNAWDGVPMGRQVASSKQSISIYEHHIGVLGNITNVELAQRLTSLDAANGFGNRFLWLAVRRPHLLPFTEPVAGYITPFISAFRTTLEFIENGRYMKMSDKAARARVPGVIDRVGGQVSESSAARGDCGGPRRRDPTTACSTRAS